MSKRFSKEKFNEMMKSIANDINFKTEIAIVKKGELDSIDEIEVSKKFRKWCKKLLIDIGMDKNDANIVMDESFEFTTMDGLYEFFTTVIYEFIDDDNTFNFIPKKDFKGSIALKKHEKKKKKINTRNPQTGESLGTWEMTIESHKSLSVPNSCPEYLKTRKRVTK